jgi:thiamine-phosphate pyrophosphorylase
LGSEKIIGGTANTLTDVIKRIEENCNYIGLGPYRFTSTKDNLSPILGLAGYKEIIKQIYNTVPIYAIGGIVASDITQILETGIYGVAMSGTLTNYPDKKELINQLNNYLYEQA